MQAKMTPCLWFDRDAEEAARFYAATVPDSRIERVTRAAVDYPAGRAGDVLIIDFVLHGLPVTLLNGGDTFRFTEAVSFQIATDDQVETDRLTDALSAVPEAEQCGWIKDRFGLSWQIVPRRLTELIADPDRARAARVMAAMMTMKRIDIAAIVAAAAG